MKFYRLPNSETYGPRVSSLIYLPLQSIFLCFYFQIYYTQKYKNTLLQFILIWRSIYQSTTIYSRPFANFWRRYPRGIDNPFNMSGCEYLLFVCRCHLRIVAWFSYWFDNLGFITEGNTYHRCAASSLRLWGNTDVASSRIKRNFWHRCQGGSSTYTRFLITNLISSQYILFAICLSYSSAPLHKNLPFYPPLFFRSPFSCQICF